MLPEVVNECDKIIKFIEKNCNLIKENSSVKVREMTVHISEGRTVRHNQEEFDRLLVLMPENEGKRPITRTHINTSR